MYSSIRTVTSLKSGILVLSSYFLFALTVNSAEASKNTTLNLETIMSDPDWMGRSPVSPHWSLNGEKVYYQRKMEGHSHNENYVLDVVTKQTTKLLDTELLSVASQSATLNASSTKGAFIYQGDVYLIDVASKNIMAVTSDAQEQSTVAFVTEDQISYRVGYDIYLYDLNRKLSKQIVSFKAKEDPDKTTKKNYLTQSQPRLLSYLASQQKEKKYQKKRTKDNRTHPVKTWYVGSKKSIRTFRISPDANWVMLGVIDKNISGKADHMPRFVTDDGYVKDEKVRSLVGTSKPLSEKFYLFDLTSETKTAISLSKLPGVNDDPLSNLRKNAAKKIGYKYQEKKGLRSVYAYDWNENQGVEWSKDSQNLAMMLFSYDNKSRWIITIDMKTLSLRTGHWLTDDAWVNDWTFNEFGWLPDDKTLYFLSEEDGYSHLYVKTGKRKSTQVTNGKFEVSNLTIGKNGERIFYKANKKHPGVYEIYSLNLKDRNSRAITDLGGMNDYALSPNNQHIVVLHSKTNRMPELYLKALDDNSSPIKLTNTMSDEFSGIDWQAPEIVEIKSSDTNRPIYSRLYRPIDNNEPEKKRPAVVFVHGAGYLQNSHKGWSGYFREYMFHNYLKEKGFVVLDMDYRASKGYGRDWRTAIYRNMGTPELQDLKDGVEWLVKNKNVDPSKVGVYGGSYGGFMAFMALFKEPELFASGAALRPVTDWSHYNHGYTSNILNTPQVDPDAFERSSPIEFAEGLNKPLLICHGMVDDNVFFKDTVRLVQRLIELKKTKYFETAIYPVEPHGFKESSSWLDEYTRIDQLFEKTLR